MRPHDAQLCHALVDELAIATYRSQCVASPPVGIMCTATVCRPGPSDAASVVRSTSGEVVGVADLALSHVEAVAAEAPALGEHDALGTAVEDLDRGHNPVRPQLRVRGHFFRTAAVPGRNVNRVLPVAALGRSATTARRLDRRGSAP